MLNADATIGITNEGTAIIGDPIDIINETLVSSSDPIDVTDRVPNWSVFKSRTSPSNSLKPTWDTDVAYEVKFCANGAIGNESLHNIRLNSKNGGGSKNLFKVRYNKQKRRKSYRWL